MDTDYVPTRAQAYSMLTRIEARLRANLATHAANGQLSLVDVDVADLRFVQDRLLYLVNSTPGATAESATATEATIAEYFPGHATGERIWFQVSNAAGGRVVLHAECGRSRYTAHAFRLGTSYRMDDDIADARALEAISAMLTAGYTPTAV